MGDILRMGGGWGVGVEVNAGALRERRQPNGLSALHTQLHGIITTSFSTTCCYDLDLSVLQMIDSFKI